MQVRGVPHGTLLTGDLLNLTDHEPRAPRSFLSRLAHRRDLPKDQRAARRRKRHVDHLTSIASMA